MALINCPECNHEVSDTSKFCPNCGFKIKKSEINKENKSKPNKVIFIIPLVVVVLIAIVVIFIVNNKNNSNVPTTARDYMDIGNYEQAIKVILADEKLRKDDDLFDEACFMRDIQGDWVFKGTHAYYNEKRFYECFSIKGKYVTLYEALNNKETWVKVGDGVLTYNPDSKTVSVAINSNSYTLGYHIKGEAGMYIPDYIDPLISSVVNSNDIFEVYMSFDGYPALVEYELKNVTIDKPAIGMSASEVLDTLWGTPKDKNITKTSSGTHEQWVYGNGKYVYLDDGVVTGVQYSEKE